MGKSSVNGPFSIAMLNNQKVQENLGNAKNGEEILATMDIETDVSTAVSCHQGYMMRPWGGSNISLSVKSVP